MSTEQSPKSTEEFAQWLKAVEHQQQGLEQQIQQFNALQSEMQVLVEQANRSPEAAKKLQKLQSLEEAPEYQQLHQRVVEKLQQLEQQFSQITQLGDRCFGSDTLVKTKQSKRYSSAIKTSVA